MLHNKKASEKSEAKKILFWLVLIYGRCISMETCNNIWVWMQ